MTPGDKAHAALACLHQLLARHSTRDVVSVYFDLCMRRANDLGFQGDLASPARQGDVLVTSLLSSTEPKDPIPFRRKDWQRTTHLLNEAFGAYQELFWPDADEIGGLSDEWKHVREVAMPAFLHYFNTGLIANPEQVRARIETYLVPFDATFVASGMLAVTDALRIADWVGSRLEKALANLNEVLDELEATRGINSASRSRILAAKPTAELLGRLARVRFEFGTVSKSELVAEFGQLGEAYWRQFSIGRGDANQIDYPTEVTVATVRPLVRLNDERAMIPSINSLWTAILEAGEEVVAGPATRERYFAHRDSTLEAEAASQFQRLMSEQARVLQGTFEHPDSRGEHDAVVIDGDTVFIVEAKASPLPEPFRDPDKAFTRLRHAFRADKGIQKGFEQAESIRRRLDSGESVPLYDRRGKQVEILDPTVLKHRYSVVVTRDDFGVLATDLALLLDRPGGSPYPWVVNILDLSAIADAWAHLKWGTRELRSYLEPRLQLHGKVFASDELELVGYHLQHGSLSTLVSNAADRVNLVPSYSDFFDELYRHQRYGGPAPVAKSTAPVVMDLRASLKAGEPVFVNNDGEIVSRAGADPNPARKMKGSERNKPCPCGSQRKFKYCCGQ